MRAADCVCRCDTPATPFERRLCRRPRFQGEVSEGAVEAPSEEWTEVR